MLGLCWAFLVAQLVENLPAMRETWVCSLGWEDPLEKGKATHSSIPAWRNSMDCIVHRVAKSQTQLSNFHFHSLFFRGKSCYSYKHVKNRLLTTHP